MDSEAEGQRKPGPTVDRKANEAVDRKEEHAVKFMTSQGRR